MEIEYSAYELLMYGFLYAFVGWAAEVLYYAVKDKHFVNRGFLNVPFALPYGISAVILLLVLPTLNGLPELQFAQCWIVYWAVMGVTEQFVSAARRERAPREEKQTRKQWVVSALKTALTAAAYMAGYLVVHPLLYWGCSFLPDTLVKILAIGLTVLVAADLGCVLYSLRTKVTLPSAENTKKWTSRLAGNMRRLIRGRLERAYPGILEEQNPNRSGCVFAQGICADKLVWVFFVSSFLGALIEMLFCRVTSGRWMSRSSVLYGPFSFVWGFGAVLLTITLQRAAQKADRYVFLSGFLVGGAYEYLCSVFTELVFGTVFWDYSYMPLNIGGRTNVLYCIFWGILAVVWVKILYPPMSKGIEKIPALPGKLLTWAVLLIMVCNGILTAAAMVRYTDRQTNPTPDNVIARYLDSWYDDEWMENRWPNMILAE